MKTVAHLIKTTLFLLFFSLVSGMLYAQKADTETIRKQIERYKEDARGPYKDLRWFCPDGSVVPPQERCPQGGGKQRARYKDDVNSLQKTNHLFLGQILATTDYSDFWDAANSHSRLKQYQLEKYLRNVDNGWILKKAQYYRGAIQAEDEEAWGINFFSWLLSDKTALRQHFFLIRQSVKDIPHRSDNNQAQQIRSLSQVIAEQYAPFMDLRIKIHGQPQESDIEKVLAFKEQHTTKMSTETVQKMDELIESMRTFYRPIDMQSLQKFTIQLSSSSPLKDTLEDFLQASSNAEKAKDKVAGYASMMLEIRSGISDEEKAAARLALLDISNILEELIYKEAAKWEPENLNELLHKIYYLGKAAAGAGYLELWEWQQISDKLTPPESPDADIETLNRYLQIARSQVEWGTGIVKAVYQETTNQFQAFEPLAYGFIDDRIRSSVLLPLGRNVGRLGDFIADQSGLNNNVMGIANQSHMRGLNPGFAYGELVVVTGSPDDVEVSSDKIYIFERPPSDLKPVAGIATVSEGNLVSHVQLLARNLGIPNAVLSNTNLKDLQPFSGQMVFYAVSGKGTVIMKPESKMNRQEKALFAVKQRDENKINVPVDNIDLSQRSILNLRDVQSSFSGKLYGPKAANLGQLKRTFPDKVVEGLVLPFGIFREHMDQQMPGREISYWQYLNNVFTQADKMRSSGAAESDVENYQIRELESLREAIKTMPLLPSFEQELEQRFRDILGKPMGEVPVFIRSDTNMEDLKDFTGAGLNLTVFNVLDKKKIIQGIKDVWASPYTERSFRWRQKYLLNPENVYPSLLIIPSVDVDYSGVLITKGISSGIKNDLTIAFSRGAGGAVDGQVAESYLIKPSGEAVLIAPSREPYYNVLPLSGGLERKAATFDNPILKPANIEAIQELANTVKKVLPNTPGIGSGGPYDIELGFKDDKIWLFQVRPFVENKKAASSAYLDSITPRTRKNQKIKLSTRL